MVNKKLFYGILFVGVIGIALSVITLGLAEELTVVTDRQEYSQGEHIKVTLTNNLDKSIYSHAASVTPVFSIGHIEKRGAGGTWENLFAQCQYPHCVYDMDFPREIKPKESVSFDWQPLIYIEGTAKHVQAASGTYRLTLLYQIREGSLSKDWDWKVVKSNEFVIK